MISAVYSLLAIHLHIPTRSAVAPSRASFGLNLSFRRPRCLSNRRTSFSSDDASGALSYEELVALERQTDALYQKEMLSGVYDERRRCLRSAARALLHHLDVLRAPRARRRARAVALGGGGSRVRAPRPPAGRRRPRSTPRRRVARVRPVPGDLDRHGAAADRSARAHAARAAGRPLARRVGDRDAHRQPPDAAERAQAARRRLPRYCSARALMLLLAPPAEVEAASAACPADAPPGSCPPAASLLASAHPDAALPAARQEVRSCHCSTGRTALVRHSKTVHLYSPLLPLPSGGRGGAPRARAVGRDGVRRPLPPARLPCGVR